ncbi:TetR/AcrR family transcriptional regulator [Nocardia alni]|uniref:TetR/AcrR family transcriptional regulator n=1 Tax=Nocardia alni TaxID=2815723 RepID=UPI001C24F03C|nr:TetR/AcrR family transcriptional regulator [Nocardia alni]
MPPEAARPTGSRPPARGYAAGQATRLRLLEVAEELFADRGIDAVSLNEVRLAAGQSNAGAINYHFGSKSHLLRAVIEHRLVRIEAERGELLATLITKNRGGDPRALLEALILPQAASIGRGERYVGLISHLLAAPHGGYSEHIFLLADPDLVPNGLKINELLGACLTHLPPPVAQRRLTLLYTSTVQALAQFQRRASTGQEPPPELFVAELIDAVTPMLTTPMSPETLTQLECQRQSTDRDPM